MDILKYHADLLKVRFQRVKPQHIEHPDCIELIAANGDRCFIDYEDRDLTTYQWQSTNGYFNRVTSRSHAEHPSKILYLHCLVLERKLGRLLESEKVTDHINWDRQNNRRSNLRVATKSQNACNSKLRESSEYRGVTKAAGTYRVQLRYTVSIDKSGFRSGIDAAKHYDEMAAQYHGKFAVFNFPEDWIYDFTSERYVKIIQSSNTKQCLACT